MAKYGSHLNFSLEFRDLQATTMSLDSSGQYALLAGRKYLGILDLSGASGDLLVRIPYGGKYEISSTQWSSLNNANVLAVASSQRCDIFELTDSAELKCTYRLKCHSRVITDIDWSSLQPNLLATSSFDTFVHIWDIRIPRQAGTEKPQQSLTALDGASSVRWNKWKTETLASCDGGHVKIWDLRKPTAPSEYIAAHASKINGLEWLGSDVVITAAQDCTVKFSRLAPVKPKAPFLTLSAPVWRARPAPFGRGIVTQCVPILRRDSGLLSLWDWKRLTIPIFTFQAHDIVEFSWKRDDKTNVIELITWSRDQILRVWTLPAEIVELCGEESKTLNRRASLTMSNENEDAVEDKTEELFEDGEFTNTTPNNSNQDSSPKTKDGSLERRLHRRKSLTTSNITKRDELLKKEFDAVSESKPDAVIFEQVEIERGMLRFSWRTDPKSRALTVGIVTSFPLNYPAAVPQFLVTSTSSGNDVDKGQILTILKHTATQCARRKEPCLSACITQFAAHMNLIKPVEILDDFSAFPSRGVSNVPFPRTSGARFCSVGVLICFGRPSYLRRVKLNCDAGTPRSLSALGPFLSQLAHDNDEVTLRRRSRRGERKRAGLVTIFDCCQLLPFSRELASGYKHLAPKPRDRSAICLDNEKQAVGLNFTRVGHAWQAASIVAKYVTNSNVNKFGQREITSLHSNESSEDDEDVNWIHYHPLGSKLINSIIQHYAFHGDVQTAASIACLFTEQIAGGYVKNGQQNIHHGNGDQLGFSRNGTSSRNNQLKQPGMSSPYHTVHSSDTLHGVVVCPLSESFFRQHRSNSWSDSLDDSKAIQSIHETGLHNGNGGTLAINNGGLTSSFTNGFLGRGPTTAPRTLILNPSMTRLYDCYKKSYAEILYRWGYLQQRAEVLKCLTEGVDSSFLLKQGVDIVIQCKVCDQPARGPFCLKCKRIVSFCAICHAPTKGLSTYCLACGHGGHSTHMLQWFHILKRTTCPTGCGCKCLENINNFKQM